MALNFKAGKERSRRQAQGHGLSKRELALLAEDTLARLEQDPATLRAAETTVTYLPENLPLRWTPPAEARTLSIEVWEGTSLSACQRLKEQSDHPHVVLNFASARNPGGGFQRGASAQEESLCRASGLYFCIKGSRMYELNRHDNRQCLYHNAAIYSPDVPIVTDDNGKPFDHTASFITCPAPNAKEARKRGVPDGQLATAMAERIDLVLSVAAHHGHDVLVLGAFGCGVFGNNVEDVAQQFKRALRSSKFAGCFSTAIFPALSERDQRAFDKVFGRR